VDTRHLSTAARAADAGVRLWNLPFPHHLPEQAPLPEVRAVLARFDGVVLMHSRGTPETMAGLTHYEGALVEAVAGELLAMTERLCGEDPALLSRILYDPGLGFAKQAGQSLLLLGQVGRLRRRLGRPLLVGASRKSFLGQATGLPVEERLIPSVVAAALAAAQGADVVRVHDVAETRAAVLMAQAVMRSGEGGGA
jgi:dihydropteroate synthase